MGTRAKVLKLNQFVVITTRPTALIREMEKVLRKHAGKDWSYDFQIEDAANKP